MQFVVLVFVLVVSLLHLPASASPSSDALAACFSDNTNGKDRKELAKWIFASMSAHPDIGAIARPEPATIESAQRSVGVLVTRLIAESCPNEMRAVVKVDGAAGIRGAFEQLGKMAMQELITNQRVAETIGGFERFVDKARVEPVMSVR